jgi:hypothetical protein
LGTKYSDELVGTVAKLINGSKDDAIKYLDKAALDGGAITRLEIVALTWGGRVNRIADDVIPRYFSVPDDQAAARAFVVGTACDAFQEATGILAREGDSGGDAKDRRGESLEESTARHRRKGRVRDGRRQRDQQGARAARHPSCVPRPDTSRHLQPARMSLLESGFANAPMASCHHGRRRRTETGGGGFVGVIIIREMVGTSPRSWSDAARQAVATASHTVRNIQTVEVVKSTAIVADGEIVEYRVEVKIGFEYEG